MPACFCNSHNCGGAVRSRHTVTSHKVDDDRARAHIAVAAYDNAIQQQESELTAHISSLTLLDELPADHLSHGRIWTSPIREPHAGPTFPSTRSRRPFHELLEDIKGIERDLDLLEVQIQTQLELALAPLTKTDEFPFTSAYELARELQSRTRRLEQPHQRKEIVEDRLSALLRSIRTAGCQWDAKMKLLHEESHFEDRGASSNYDTAHHFEPILGNADPVVQLTMFTMTVFDVILNFSRRGCHFLLFFAQYLVQLTLSRHQVQLSSRNAEFVSKFPLDPDTVTQKFPLDGKAVVYAVCPNAKCHKTYPPDFSSGSLIPQYPKFCTYNRFSGGVACGTALTQKHKSGANVQVPIKKFVSFSFKDFVATLLSRSALEELMDNPVSSPDDRMRDVHDGEYLRSFTDDHNNPFKSTYNVGRYTFSLGVDFFNPFGNKQAGLKSSVGVLTVVCLNLPAQLRYKTENMFLAGVIPGPNEPPLDAINHYLTPLVDELVEFWSPGIHFSRTAKNSDGRLVICALVLIVCDLLAARKTAGFASCTHEHFCSVCNCVRSKDGYARTDYHKWQRRTNDECRVAAELFRSAPDGDAQMKQFNQSGMRWSELLRLPYLDIARCLVVDSMHNLFLGLLKEHFTNILGIGLPPHREPPAFTLPNAINEAELTGSDCRGVKRLKGLLEAPYSVTLLPREQGLKKFTSNVTSNALKFVCQNVGCLEKTDSQKRTKADLAGLLLNWRSAQPETREHGADTSTQVGHVLNLADMEEIWSDLEKILTPSWVTSVPSNLGNAAHGKLRADEWRVLGTVHLPLSLTRLWGTDGDTTNPRSLRCREVLNVTMSLMSAVRVATSLTISRTEAKTYLQHMLDYLNGVKSLFPDYKLHPNHHMSLHIYDFILLYGPVHSWWTFPFERLIGSLQRMPHNFKLGQLEETIARAYTRSSNLRAILLREGCPEVIKNCQEAFRKLISPQTHNPLVTMMRVLPSLDQPNLPLIPQGRVKRPLPRELVDILRRSFPHLPSSGYLLADITIRGLTYSTSTKHSGNSCVMIASEPGSNAPAQIASIVQFDDNMVFLTVRRHKEMNLRYDPFSCYGSVRARVWAKAQLPLEVVKFDTIVCHFACMPLASTQHEEAIAVVPLWRG